LLRKISPRVYSTRDYDFEFKIGCPSASLRDQIFSIR